MKRKLIRTVLSLLVAVGCVFAFRWTVRATMGRVYAPKRVVGTSEIKITAVPKKHALDKIIPEELHINIAGMPLGNTARRLGVPYALAVEMADGLAESEGWKRMDDEDALTVSNLSGMRRLYRTPSGGVVLRELTPVKGDDTLMEDISAPVDLLESSLELPDELARAAARRVREIMPAVIGDVVLGSPMMTYLIRRGNGAAFLVHSLAELSPSEAKRTVETAALEAGWKATGLPGGALPAEMSPAMYVKENLTFVFEAVPRKDGSGSDLDYRFSDDEVYDDLKKGKTNED